MAKNFIFKETPMPGQVARGGIAIVDFGSQYSQLIARRVREQGVYAELFPADAPAETVTALEPRGVILSGGPNSVYQPGALQVPRYVLESGLPVLGICYGMQTLAHALGGRVAPARAREYGPAQVSLAAETPLWAGLPSQIEVWMSHADRIEVPPPGFVGLARSANSPYAAIGDLSRGLYGVQFHPEVAHTPRGVDILRNFLFEICHCQPTWTPAAFIEEAVVAIRAQVGEGRVVLGLSGGVDSAVTAALVHRAVSDQLTCILIDHGMLRLGEPEQVIETFQRQLGLKLMTVDASEKFLTCLEGVIDPEDKRRVIGEQFIRAFEAQARQLGQVDFLAQGTIYPDVIESAARDRGGARRIKSHHNVGGLPEEMRFKLVEPLRYLFKDEVRRVGIELGLPDEIVWRQPFPGPGLAVRCLGPVTRERLERLRRADAIFVEELRTAGMLRGALPSSGPWPSADGPGVQTGRETAQAFAVLLPARSVGVMGDSRTYAEVVALRAVSTADFMTADWSRLPAELLARVSNRIVNEVPGVNRVVYDITSKPPATIEWE
jgi:GMP synthase (glutamine-hydrolysing)